MEDTTVTQSSIPRRAGSLGEHVRRNLFPYAAGAIFVLLTAGFGIATGGVSLRSANLRLLVNSGVLVAIVSTVAVFVYSMGMLDISLGTNVALGTIVGACVLQATGNFPLCCLAIFATTVLISLVSGTVIGIFSLPAFIVTLVIMNVLSAFNTLLVSAASGGGNMIALSEPILRRLDTIPVKLLCLGAVLFLSILLFNFTPLGRQNKVLGANRANAVLCGIHPARNTVLSFLIMGCGLAVASILFLCRVRAGASANGSSYGFEVMLALVLGGMPISGGPRSHILSGLIGSFIITELQIGLNTVGVDMASIQIVRGLAFLVILFVLNFRSRSKYLI